MTKTKVKLMMLTGTVSEAVLTPTFDTLVMPDVDKSGHPIRGTDHVTATRVHVAHLHVTVDVYLSKGDAYHFANTMQQGLPFLIKANLHSKETP